MSLQLIGGQVVATVGISALGKRGPGSTCWGVEISDFGWPRVPHVINVKGSDHVVRFVRTGAVRDGEGDVTHWRYHAKHPVRTEEDWYINVYND